MEKLALVDFTLLSPCTVVILIVILKLFSLPFSLHSDILQTMERHLQGVHQKFFTSADRLHVLSSFVPFFFYGVVIDI
jgi:hypothetical protein